MKRVVFEIHPLYRCLGDRYELPEYYIVKSVYYFNFLLRRKTIGQDLNNTPFQDIENVEEYLKMIL
jgi:hypothetical protein